ncbi:hypothetical protein PAPYR_2817 [Paratrimastix pyriformis]|uniref:Uncharacterized protein n=1 Tax=Paratrimastix pyriformis TaxID=342808 RepID=A0ABQ8UP57_9EUKA|nr:hypothetical protein PAPYR_2817 [Paratrimastix pyriformis]
MELLGQYGEDDSGDPSSDEPVQKPPEAPPDHPTVNPASRTTTPSVPPSHPAPAPAPPPKVSALYVPDFDPEEDEESLPSEESQIVISVRPDLDVGGRKPKSAALPEQPFLDDYKPSPSSTSGLSLLALLPPPTGGPAAADAAHPAGIPAKFLKKKPATATGGQQTPPTATTLSTHLPAKRTPATGFEEDSEVAPPPGVVAPRPPPHSGPRFSAAPDVEVPRASPVIYQKKKRREEEPIQYVEINQADIIRKRPGEENALPPEVLDPIHSSAKPNKVQSTKHHITALLADAEAKQAKLEEKWRQSAAIRMETRNKYGWAT